MKRYILVFILLICTSFICNAKGVHIKKYAKKGSEVSSVLQNLVDKYDTIYIDKGTWKIDNTIKLRSNVHIIGVDKKKSILTANNRVLDKHYFMFATDNNLTDNFKKPGSQEVKYENISFENLTFKYDKVAIPSNKLRNTWYYTVMIVGGKNCKVDKCNIFDTMNSDSNNGFASIAFVYSEDCSISRCTTKNSTLAILRYCNNIKVSNNHGTNSVGTWIESQGGSGIQVVDNELSDVLWNVSCIGINSKNSRIENNIISSKSYKNISCLTLGHDVADCEADGSIAQNNQLVSAGGIGLIVQNGHSVTIDNNSIQFVGGDDKSLVEGGIVIGGKTDNLYDVKISNNSISNHGEASSCVLYRGKGKVQIHANKLSGYQGIRLYNAAIDEADITDNIITDTKTWSIASTAIQKLVVHGNKLSDGIISTAKETKAEKNIIDYVHKKDQY